jgi:hypothetical protein
MVVRAGLPARLMKHSLQVVETNTLSRAGNDPQWVVVKCGVYCRVHDMTLKEISGTRNGLRALSDSIQVHRCYCKVEDV